MTWIFEKEKFYNKSLQQTVYPFTFGADFKCFDKDSIDKLIAATSCSSFEMLTNILNLASGVEPINVNELEDIILYKEMVRFCEEFLSKELIQINVVIMDNNMCKLNIYNIYCDVYYDVNKKKIRSSKIDMEKQRPNETIIMTKDNLLNILRQIKTFTDNVVDNNNYVPPNKYISETYLEKAYTDYDSGSEYEDCDCEEECACRYREYLKCKYKREYEYEDDYCPYINMQYHD